MDIFEKASRLKLRFTTTKGLLSTEDLWDLSLTSLDTIAKAVNKRLKEENEESFITTRSKSNSELELSLDILKHIITVKLEEKEKATLKAERRAELELLRNLRENKKMEALNSLSLEEIDKKMAELEN